MKNNNDVEWILIEDKLKKEWNKQDAYNKKEKEEDKIINFKEAVRKLQKKRTSIR
tara:strand:- start:452 stop:616 length:165 start_codon:yes stop_codon:yes gene_type:complete